MIKQYSWKLCIQTVEPSDLGSRPSSTTSELCDLREVTLLLWVPHLHTGANNSTYPQRLL
jgi:hypothetical protein